MIGLYNITSYTLLPCTCGIVIICVGYIKLWKLRKAEYPETVGIYGIWLMGIISFLLGIFGQLMSMINTFDIIAQVGDISASIVAEGIKRSYQSTVIGLVVLIISLIIWGILRGTKQKRIITRKIKLNEL